MYQFLPDLAYGGDARQVLDLYLPQRSSPPLFFFIHGGGWRGGDKQFYRPLGELLANFGFAVALANHRLAPAYPYPAAIEDVAAALACVRRYGEETGVRGDGIYLGGHSSGAHLAALLALHPRYRAAAGVAVEQIAGVIGISGVYDLAAYRNLSPASDEYLAVAFGRQAEVYREASPLGYVRAPAPAFFLACAEFDIPGAAAQARALQAALQRAGGQAEFVEVEGRDHVTILSGVQSILDPLAVGLTMFLHSRR